MEKPVSVSLFIAADVKMNASGVVTEALSSLLLTDDFTFHIRTEDCGIYTGCQSIDTLTKETNPLSQPGVSGCVLRA